MVTATASRNGASAQAESITISPPNFRTLVLRVRGTAPFVQERFGDKAKRQMRDKQEAGSTAKKGAKKDARDFEADFRDSLHIAEDGWYGIPATAFRNAAIDACRMAGYQMTRAKMSVFVQADGIDRNDGTPLVRLDGGEPEMSVMPTRNATGVADLRARGMWRQWGCTLRVEFDADQFTASDVVNLLNRAGRQVGVGAGRPFSKNSAGLGWGTWALEEGDAA